MANIDPSDASRALREAHSVTQNASATLVQGRVRWAVAGGAVFAASVLAWLSGPGSSNLITLVLVVAAVVAAVAARFPQAAGITGQRARLTGAARRRVRTLSLVTMLGVVAMLFAFHQGVLFLLDEPYPIAGALVGLVLAVAGPRFAKWWMADPGSRR
ncbi:hypothetical protein ACFO4E_28295 [Nocardiopsis mangrovi]|uniref:Uncharacterized protein n=1 Tax=Nocardiopsis mangrovi TaxID=1179818 RepID=A0ABV9E3W7_9ACTN